MTSYASNQAGSWDTTTVWTPNGTPGDGDEVVVAHAVTVDSNTTIGTSPAENSGNFAISVQSGATLTVSNNVTLTLRGDGRNNNGKIVFGNGCILEFDASQASSPTTQNYRYDACSGTNQAESEIIFNGTTGNRNTVRSNASGGTGYFAAGGIKAGFEAYFTDFEDINDPATNIAQSIWANNANRSFIIEDCTMDAGCGEFGQSADFGGIDYIVRRTNHAGTLGVSFRLVASSAIAGGEFREFDDVYCASEVTANSEDLTLKGTNYGNVFAGGFSIGASADIGMSDTFVYSSVVMSKDSNDVYVLMDGLTNPHVIFMQDTKNASITLQDFTVELDGNFNGDFGDIVLGTNAPATSVIKGFVIVPQDDGGSWGALPSLLGDSTQTWTVEHNTFPAGFNLGETYAGHAGMIGSYKSNIVWLPSEDLAEYAVNNLGGLVNDTLAGGNADYNNHFNLGAGSEGGGYDTPMTAAPGTNDFDVDPNFLDSARDMASWDASLGGAGTRANALVELAKMHLGTWDTNYTMKAMATWVRAGFQTQEATLENAGHDAVTVGAMAFIAVTLPEIFLGTGVAGQRIHGFRI